MENFASNNFYEPWKINPQTQSKPESRSEIEPNSQEKVSVAQAQQYITGILNETMMMGANDYESGALMELFEKVKIGTIEPAQAMKDALTIQQSKNAYH